VGGESGFVVGHAVLVIGVPVFGAPKQLHKQVTDADEVTCALTMRYAAIT